MSSLSDPDGLVNLQHLAEQLSHLPHDLSVPIVLVPGFSGWGSPLFGAVNYWGGIENVPGLLVAKGYTLIIPTIAPLSSNWERACELYRQLTVGRFTSYNAVTNEIEDIYDLDVDYGAYFDSDPHNRPKTSKTTARKRALLFTASPEKYARWKWDEKHKVHFICHSQGGNTVRYLISLMAHGADGLHPQYFNVSGRDNWAISVTTLGTPHRGTTVIDVLENLVPDFERRLKLVAKLFATTSYQPQRHRAYDLQLDHWEICRDGNEAYEVMQDRFQLDSGPVAKWLRSNRNGFYDNSIKGVQELHRSADPTSRNVYYFSFSFHATSPFPSKLPPWTLDVMKSFPMPVSTRLRKVARYVPFLTIIIWIFDQYLSALIYKILWAIFSRTISMQALMGWATKDLLGMFLNEMGYKVNLPLPGKYVPRIDVIPPMMMTGYGMCSQELSSDQMDLLGILGDNQGDWFQNDGVVNTESMRGPTDSCIRPIKDFPISDIDTSEARGTYWHMGVNDRMDHADEIGVFIDEDTSHATRKMYFDLAKLVIRLPSA